SIVFLSCSPLLISRPRPPPSSPLFPYTTLFRSWSVTAAGHRFKDTCQVVARKALRTLCQIYEEEVADTPLRFFPPFQRDCHVWKIGKHTSELQSRFDLVCRLLLEKKKQREV